MPSSALQFVLLHKACFTLNDQMLIQDLRYPGNDKSNTKIRGYYRTRKMIVNPLSRSLCEKNLFLSPNQVK